MNGNSPLHPVKDNKTLYNILLYLSENMEELSVEIEKNVELWSWKEPSLAFHLEGQKSW